VYAHTDKPSASTPRATPGGGARPRARVIDRSFRIASAMSSNALASNAFARAFARAIDHGAHRGRRRTTRAGGGRARAPARAKLNDEAKFVKDSRDDARAKSAPDAGEQPHELEGFRTALTSGSNGGDSPMTQTLNKEFGVAGFIRVRDGRGNATKATLTHPSGAYADVYLRGANVVSWTLASGGEVFYVEEGASFKKHAPTDGGNPICFPQYGAGGQRAGSVHKAYPKMPQDGFASQLEWRLTESGKYVADDGTPCPFVVLETTDDDYSRSVFPHSFKLSMEISLEYTALKVKTTVHNTGPNMFEYALGYKAHIAVTDAKEGDVYYVGLDDCVVLDNELHPTKPRVRFTSDLDPLEEKCFRLHGKTDRVYLNANDAETGVEVGTGCTVFVENVSGEAGCVDRAVFSPWDTSPNTYRWYAGLGIGNFGKLRIAKPDSKSSTEIRYHVVDSTPSVRIREEIEQFERVSALNALARPKFDLSTSDLPTDMQ